MEKKHLTKNLQDTWTEKEADTLAQAITFAHKNQHNYKEPLDLEVRMQGWKFVLEQEFCMEQVLYALREFMMRSTEMPLPANIYNILNPLPPKIAPVAYMAALDYQKNNDYPLFSWARDTIRDYQDQESDARDDFKIQNEEIAKIVGNSVKRIT